MTQPILQRIFYLMENWTGIDTYDIQYQNLNNKNGVHRVELLLTQFKDFPQYG